MRWLGGILDSMDMSLGGGERQGSLACCSPWGHKQSDTTEQHRYHLLLLPRCWVEGPNSLFTVALLVLSIKFSRRWYINLRVSISKSGRKWGSHIPRNTGRSISLQKSRLFLCICYIKNVWGQPFPRFLASGTDFMEDNFSMGQGGWGGMVWGWFKLITFIVHFISNLMLPLM